MTHEYKITIKVEQTGENTTLSGQFDDEDWKRLDDFSQYADELLDTKHVQSGMSAALNIHWNQETGLAVATELPPWDDVIVFLHKFRPIGLQSERTYFYNICNILAKELTNSYFRNVINEQRELFAGKVMQQQFQIQSNDVILNSERVLYDWLNSYEYHRDEEKRQFIDSLHTLLPLEASKVLFVALLTEKVKAIHNIATLVRVVLGKQKSVEGHVRLSK
jgi:hypothetical protein